MEIGKITFQSLSCMPAQSQFADWQGVCLESYYDLLMLLKFDMKMCFAGSRRIRERGGVHEREGRGKTKWNSCPDCNFLTFFCSLVVEYPKVVVETEGKPISPLQQQMKRYVCRSNCRSNTHFPCY